MQPTNEDIEVYRCCIQAGMTDKFARCMIGQARNESGNWQSQSYLDDNNPFGMNYSSNNPFAVPSISHFNNEGASPVPYAHYNTLGDAIAAQILFFQNGISNVSDYDINQMQDPDGYCNELWQNGYFTGTLATLSDYENIVDSYFTTFDQPEFWAGIIAELNKPAPMGGLIMLVLVAAALFFTSKK